MCPCGNDALAYCKKIREQAGKTPSGYDLKKIVVTQGKQDPRRAWLAEVSSVVLNESVLDLAVAFKNFFASLSGKRKGKRVSPPRFKNRRGRQSIRLTRAGFSLKGGKVYIAKVGRIPIVWSRPLPSVPSSVTIIKDASSRYFASFVCEVEPEPLEGGAESVGVDLGVATFARLSTGEKITAPKPLKKRLKRLRKLQRNLARKQKGSWRRERARKRVAKLHAKIRDTRTDFLHKLTTRLIRENQAVMVEDLNVSGMVKNRKLSRAISNLAWRQFRTLLEGKGIRYGRTVHVIDRWEPTSQDLFLLMPPSISRSRVDNPLAEPAIGMTLNERGGRHQTGLPAASGEASTCRDGQQLQPLLFA